MNGRKIIVRLSVLLLAAVIAYNWEVVIPWFKVSAILWKYLLHTGAALIVCLGLFYLFKPIAGCLIRVLIFLLALLFIL